MNHYRLLRDNKETGPYSEEEIILKGFKPYDLIWVEGKSAGWRYPSEINELKKYAPVVEEQPYDRFYKKSAPQKNLAADERSNYQATLRSAIERRESFSTTAASSEVKQSNAPVVSAEKHIHVTLPAEPKELPVSVATTSLPVRNMKVVPETQPRYAATAAPEIEKPAEKQQAPTTPASEPKLQAPKTLKIAVPTSTLDRTRQQPTANSVNETSKPVYSASTATKVESTTFGLDAAANQKQPYSYPVSNRSDFSWTMMLGLLVGIASFVGLGIMIGRGMNSNKIASTEITANSKLPKPVLNATENMTPPSVSPEKQAEKPIQTTQDNGTNSIAEKDLVRNAAIKTQVPATAIPAEDKKQSTGKTTGSNATGAQPANSSVGRAETMAAVRLEKLLNVTMNGYKVGAFGGISDLQCTLFNASPVAVDLVDVEIQYIQSNDKVFKTEKISFKDIPAGGQVTIVAPKSSRGIKVVTRIIKINARDSGMSNTTVKS